MKNKNFEDMLKEVGVVFEMIKKDLEKTADEIVDTAKTTCNEVKKTAGEMFKEVVDAPFNDGKVSTYNTGKQFLVTILNGKGFVRESLSVKVVKTEFLLNVSYISNSTNENVKFKETSSFEISVPEECDFDKGVKASIKEGYIQITFEIKEKETDTVKVEIS